MGEFHAAAFAVFASVLAHVGVCFAQPFIVDGTVRTQATDDQLPAFSARGPRPARGVVVQADHAAVREILRSAPMEQVGRPLAEYGIAIELPSPDEDGGMVVCYAAYSPVMDPALAERFPEIKTYLVASADRSAVGGAVGRLEIAPRGLSAMLRTWGDEGRGGTWMIDPWRSGDPSRLVSYRGSEIMDGGDWTCHTAQEPSEPASAPAGFSPRAVQDLRQFRLAMACTGEYGLYHSTIQGNEPNVSDPLAAIVTVVSRTNVVFENDLGVRFLLIPTNDRLVFCDPETDPFPTTCDGADGADCSGPVSAALGSVLRTYAGSPYDTGHAVTRISGGVASLSAACYGGLGVSGIPRGGDIDPFSPNVVIHELGHQFGGTHTFSGRAGRCSGNISTLSAWEAGSGSSPLSYAGGCPVGDAPPSDNVVQYADPYFHLGSIEQMENYLASPLSRCSESVATSNLVPTITSVTPDSPIPPGTPFTLSLTAEDPDGDALTVSWEQYDSGAQRRLSDPDNGRGSLFRIFPPISSVSRTFPRAADVLSGVATPGERLPRVTGFTRRSRGVVRDNRPGVGATAITATVNLQIPAGSSAFRVTAPRTEGPSYRVRSMSAGRSGTRTSRRSISLWSGSRCRPTTERRSRPNSRRSRTRVRRRSCFPRSGRLRHGCGLSRWAVSSSQYRDRS